MGTKSEAVTANYKHDCPADCGQPIRPGDRIIHQDGGYVHEDCYDPFLDLEEKEPRHRADPVGLRRGERVCPDCNLVHPGECF